MGIGTNTPVSDLEVSRLVSGDAGGTISISNRAESHNSTAQLVFRKNTGNNVPTGGDDRDITAKIVASHTSVSGGRSYLDFYTRAQSSAYLTRMMRIIESSKVLLAPDSGNVGIGTHDPDQRLHVNGNTQIDGNLYVANSNILVSGEVHANKFRATLDIPWPDYVFDPSYYLPNLSYVEQFVAAHRHLPGLPSAQTIEKDGIELAEMNALLLKKIEELTLYLIEQQKELNDLKVKMARIENQ